MKELQNARLLFKQHNIRAVSMMTTQLKTYLVYFWGCVCENFGV